MVGIGMEAPGCEIGSFPSDEGIFMYPLESGTFMALPKPWEVLTPDFPAGWELELGMLTPILCCFRMLIILLLLVVVELQLYHPAHG